MADERLTKMARLLIDYSLKIQKGEHLLINASYLAEPLIKEIYREAIKKGAYVDTEISISGLSKIFYDEATDEQLQYISSHDKFKAEYYDAELTLWGGNNTKVLSNVESVKIKKRSAARREINTRFVERFKNGDLKWCGTQFPTHSSAQDANMSLEEYEDFVYDAALLNSEDPVAEWERISQKQEKICRYLEGKSNLYIKSKDTDLKMSISGRKWINADGRGNMPDGEVCSTPLENTVEGYIRFNYPGIVNGKEVEDIKLRFEKGRIVEANASKGKELLLALIDTDEGARYLGEFAIGTNYGIKKFTKNMLFDEKMGGTIHAALGAVPAETGGTNKSAIHWDMLCNMEDGGEIYADGELFYRNGKFLFWDI